MKGLIEGRIVHVVDEYNQHRAAVVTRVWGNGVINLFMFPDASYEDQNSFKTSVGYSEEHMPFTWHWIEPA